jgi:hypothetical protein
MKELTLTELADIGAKASRSANGHKLYGNLTVDPNKSAYVSDAPFREAFAKAVRDAVLANLVTKSDSLPDPYAELKAAKKAGKAIEVFIPDDEYGPDRWSLQENDTWAGGPDRYRIKPEPVPLDIDDIRATDEFKPLHGKTIYAPLFWDRQNVKTVRGWNTYEELAANYLRRQHGSNEWKPCTKEVTV